LVGRTIRPESDAARTLPRSRDEGQKREGAQSSPTLSLYKAARKCRVV
jgi:hypothetical protein